MTTEEFRKVELGIDENGKLVVNIEDDELGEYRRLLSEVLGLSENGGSGSITSPLDIAGCALWLDASDATTINAGTPSDGDPVSAWADKSAKGYDAAQATADNQPVFKTAIQNGKSVIRCDPTTHDQFVALSGAGLDLMRDVPGVTVAFVAVGCDAATGTNGLLSVSDGLGTTNFRAYIELQTVTSPVFSNLDGTTNAFATRGASLGGLVANNLLPPLLMVLAVDFVGGQIVQERYLPTSLSGDNGDLSTATLGRTSNTASVAIEVGRLADLSGPMAGDICEVIVYQRALVEGERRQLSEYLSSKWAVL